MKHVVRIIDVSRGKLWRRRLVWPHPNDTAQNCSHQSVTGEKEGLRGAGHCSELGMQWSGKEKGIGSPPAGGLKESPHVSLPHLLPQWHSCFKTPVAALPAPSIPQDCGEWAPPAPTSPAPQARSLIHPYVFPLPLHPSQHPLWILPTMSQPLDHLQTTPHSCPLLSGHLLLAEVRPSWALM